MGIYPRSCRMLSSHGGIHDTSKSGIYCRGPVWNRLRRHYRNHQRHQKQYVLLYYIIYLLLYFYIIYLFLFQSVRDTTNQILCSQTPNAIMSFTPPKIIYAILFQLFLPKTHVVRIGVHLESPTFMIFFTKAAYSCLVRP